MQLVETDVAHQESMNYAIAKTLGIAALWQDDKFVLFAKEPDADEVIFNPADDERFRLEHNIFVMYTGDKLFKAVDPQDMDGKFALGHTREMAAARFFLIKAGIESFQIPDEVWTHDYDTRAARNPAPRM